MRRSPTDHTSNPLRIDRIGTDRMWVHIRPAVGRAELRALVDRIEQLMNAGFDTIHVVTESTPHEPEPTPTTDRTRHGRAR